MLIYEWVLVAVLVPGSLPNPGVEVVDYFKTKAECLAVKGNKQNHICLRRDRN